MRLFSTTPTKKPEPAPTTTNTANVDNAELAAALLRSVGVIRGCAARLGTSSTNAYATTSTTRRDTVACRFLHDFVSSAMGLSHKRGSIARLDRATAEALSKSITPPAVQILSDDEAARAGALAVAKAQAPDVLVRALIDVVIPPVSTADAFFPPMSMRAGNVYTLPALVVALLEKPERPHVAPGYWIGRADGTRARAFVALSEAEAAEHRAKNPPAAPKLDTPAIDDTEIARAIIETLARFGVDVTGEAKS